MQQKPNKTMILIYWVRHFANKRMNSSFEKIWLYNILSLESYYICAPNTKWGLHVLIESKNVVIFVPIFHYFICVQHRWELWEGQAESWWFQSCACGLHVHSSGLSLGSEKLVLGWTVETRNKKSILYFRIIDKKIYIGRKTSFSAHWMVSMESIWFFNK